ncbi:putative F-box protein PP2-B12 isoform X1 [Ziziphus jujuba]|uniref:F-box protein PP2-B12 isoform X1 n=2 Tax=Ziziphus jujuba TaxID=326968 RepID=A0A6P4A1Z3_ZIZJJ|nr:putative F-box protein PP2-B12 isoform X1 [Ziziphus jujuba]
MFLHTPKYLSQFNCKRTPVCFGIKFFSERIWSDLKEFGITLPYIYIIIYSYRKYHSLFFWFLFPEKENQRKMEITKLPEECISRIISFTSPRDACRSALVCALSRSAMDSDLVWRKFLPHDYHQILSNSLQPSLMDSLSMKQLFVQLSHHPVLVNDELAIDKNSGKKCYLMGARRLAIIWGSSPQYWQWISLRSSRFSEVPELKLVWWFEIKGRIETNILSLQATYAVYFVYKLSWHRYQFHEKPVTVQVNFEGDDEIHGEGYGSREVLLGPPENGNMQLPCGVYRGDGWMEVELGEFFNDGGEGHGVVAFSLMETDNYTCKFGVIVEGIELRPKAG